MSEGDKLWAWQSQEPDGRWSMVGALIPGIGHSPLVHRNKDIVEQQMSALAMEHAVRTHTPLRLVRFDLAETLREYRPDE